MTNGLDFINDANDIFKKEDVVIVSDYGKEYKFEMCKKLRDSDVVKIVNELNKNSTYCSRANKQYDLMMDMYAILIKRFTNIEFKTYKDTWKQIQYQISVCECMVDLGVYKKIIEMFDVESIKKLQDAFGVYGKTFDKINNRFIKHELDGQKE